jgi:hypothetical protein
VAATGGKRRILGADRSGHGRLLSKAERRKCEQITTLNKGDVGQRCVLRAIGVPIPLDDDLT